MSGASIPGLIVSRETLEKLNVFHDMLRKWTLSINLISRYSSEDIWNRHIWDSAQLVPMNYLFKHWMDIGSGGGFPGLVVAVFSTERNPDQAVTLVESDQRKSAFLRSVIRELKLNADVITKRIQDIEPLRADVVSARALADLDTLLQLSERHLSAHGTAYFLKGRRWEKEVQDARKSWSFTLRAHKSYTNDEAAILEIREIERV